MTQCYVQALYKYSHDLEHQLASDVGLEPHCHILCTAIAESDLEDIPTVRNVVYGVKGEEDVPTTPKPGYQQTRTSKDLEHEYDYID